MPRCTLDSHHGFGRGTFDDGESLQLSRCPHTTYLVISARGIGATPTENIHGLLSGEESSGDCAGGMLAEYEAAAGLLAQLKEMAPHPLWPRQAPTPAHPRPTSAAALAVVVRVCPL